MCRKLTGMVRALALIVSGASLAGTHGQTQRQQQTAIEEQQEQVGVGGGQQAGMPDIHARPGELTGEVVRISRDTLFVEHLGAVVPIRIQRETEFVGGLTRGQLQEGQEVRATLRIENQTQNVAVQIAPARPEPLPGEMPPERPMEPMPQPTEPLQPMQPQGGG